MLSAGPYCSSTLRCESAATEAERSVAMSARQLSSSCCRRLRPSSASVSPRCTPVACQMVWRCGAGDVGEMWGRHGRGICLPDGLALRARARRPLLSEQLRLELLPRAHQLLALDGQPAEHLRPGACSQPRATPAHCHSAHPGACSQHKRATPARAHGSAGGTSCCHSSLAGGGAPPESAEPPRPQSRAPQAAGVVGCGLGWVVGRGRGGLRPGVGGGLRPGWAAAAPGRPRRYRHAGARGGPALGWRASSPSSGSGTACPQRAPRGAWRPRLSASPWGPPARCAPRPRCRRACTGGPAPRASSTRTRPPRGRRRAARAPPRPAQVEGTGVRSTALSLSRASGDSLWRVG